METELSTPRTRRESEVWQACDDLWAQSASPRLLTGDNIRDQLLKLGYKRGSPNEIYRYRNSWKESRGVSDQGEAAEGNSNASDPISRAVSMVYDQMRTQTSEAIDKLSEDYENRLQASQLEVETLKENLAVLANEKSETEKALALSLQENTNLEAEMATLKRDQIVKDEQLRSTKERLGSFQSEHDRLIFELKGFHEREIDLWREKNAEVQNALAELKKQSKAELERQGATFSEELMGLKTELRVAYEQKSQAVAKLEVFETALEKQASTKNLLEQLVIKQHQEILAWQRKVERYLQRKVPRPLVERTKTRRC